MNRIQKQSRNQEMYAFYKGLNKRHGSFTRLSMMYPELTPQRIGQIIRAMEHEEAKQRAIEEGRV